MAHKIPVILLEDILGLGRAGDIVDVAEGFARNQLFPEGRAAIADSSAGKQALKSRAAKKKAKDEMLAQAQRVAEQLEGTELIMKARVKEGEGDEIYGSISAKDIAEELTNQTNFDFEGKHVKLKKPIRTLGTTPITILVASGIDCQIHVTVTPDEEA